MGYSDIPDIRDAWLESMDDPERESYLYWEHMMAEKFNYSQKEEDEQCE
jgi:hypothetical protein